MHYFIGTRNASDTIKTLLRKWHSSLEALARCWRSELVRVVLLTQTPFDDTAIMSSDHDPNTVSQKLQQHLNLFQNWMEQWKITVNPAKSSQITFTTRTIWPQVSINNFPIPIKQEVKYLGLHLDKKLTWQTHIKAKRRQLGLKVRTMNWLINRKLQLSLENKITLYKAIIKPVWAYG
jgi:hypothetical protein